MEDQEKPVPREVTDDPPEAVVEQKEQIRAEESSTYPYTEAVVEQTDDQEATLMTWSDIENFFIDEGEWLEEQITAEENSPYRMCPACSTAIQSLQMLHQGLKDADEQSRILLNADLKEESAIYFFSRECRWYEVSKKIVMAMMQAAHTPHLVSRVHPDIRNPGFGRKTKSTKAERKLERQRKTQARRKAK